MSDLATELHDSEELKIDGKPYTLRHLNSYDKADFVVEFRKRQKAKLLENLKTIAATPEQTLIELENFDAEPPEWYKPLTRDYHASLYACEISLKKTYGSEEAARLVKLIDLRIGEMSDLIAKLFGRWLTFSDKPPVNNATYGDGGSPPNVSAPGLTYGTPATPSELSSQKSEQPSPASATHTP